ncbi:hypothetical protein NESM_000289400 [Novymonas esmeraldas]|uniref:Uncharacterized protein n=1 Tax=Novymonas esmeraldas TaxID=1808958 RepID=A0AAW0F8C7_9TRYP
MLLPRWRSACAGPATATLWLLLDVCARAAAAGLMTAAPRIANDAAAGDNDGDDNGDASSSPLEVWWIGLLATVALLSVGTSVVLFIVYCCRSRSRRVEDAVRGDEIEKSIRLMTARLYRTRHGRQAAQEWPKGPTSPIGSHAVDAEGRRTPHTGTATPPSVVSSHPQETLLPSPESSLEEAATLRRAASTVSGTSAALVPQPLQIFGSPTQAMPQLRRSNGPRSREADMSTTSSCINSVLTSGYAHVDPAALSVTGQPGQTPAPKSAGVSPTSTRGVIPPPHPPLSQTPSTRVFAGIQKVELLRRALRAPQLHLSPTTVTSPPLLPPPPPPPSRQSNESTSLDVSGEAEPSEHYRAIAAFQFPATIHVDAGEEEETVVAPAVVAAGDAPATQDEDAAAAADTARDAAEEEETDAAAEEQETDATEEQSQGRLAEAMHRLLLSQPPSRESPLQPPLDTSPSLMAPLGHRVDALVTLFAPKETVASLPRSETRNSDSTQMRFTSSSRFITSHSPNGSATPRVRLHSPQSPPSDAAVHDRTGASCTISAHSATSTSAAPTQEVLHTSRSRRCVGGSHPTSPSQAPAEAPPSHASPAPAPVDDTTAYWRIVDAQFTAPL